MQANGEHGAVHLEPGAGFRAAYYGDKHALKGINLIVPEKQVTAMIGPSGMSWRHWSMIRRLCLTSSRRTR